MPTGRVNQNQRKIWIDATCINQANVQERNHQVTLMDKIFTQARSVRMCVQDHSGPANFSEYGQLFRSLQSDKGGDITNTESPSFLVFVHFISLHYFQRAWAIQEAALARAAYLLVNNHELLLMPIVMDRLRTACVRHKYDLPGVLRWDPGQKIEADIITCLRIGIECKSSDARDKVYALLGLMEPHARLLIPVDYSLEVESVYSNAVIAIIALQQRLDILLYASVLSDPVDFSNWSIGPHMGVEQFRYFLFHISIKGQSEAESKPSMYICRPRHSQFKGQDGIGPWESTIDVKIETSPNSDSDQENESCILYRPQPGRLDILPRIRVRAHYIDSADQVFLDARKFARAVLKDASLLNGKEYSQILPFFESQQASYPPDSDINIPVNLPLEQSQDYLPHVNVRELRNFVQSAATEESGAIYLGNYRVGIAAHETFQRGDAIFAVDGVNTPLLLRETSDHHHFRVLGACYVYAALELDYWNLGTR